MFLLRNESGSRSAYQIGKLRSLKELYVRSNKLVKLSPEIGNCTFLTLLYLYENQIKSLPPTIGHLSSLTEISLNSNALSELPREFGQLTSLTKCDLSRNELSDLPQEVSVLSLGVIFILSVCWLLVSLSCPVSVSRVLICICVVACLTRTPGLSSDQTARAVPGRE